MSFEGEFDTTFWVVILSGATVLGGLYLYLTIYYARWWFRRKVGDSRNPRKYRCYEPPPLVGPRGWAIHNLAGLGFAVGMLAAMGLHRPIWLGLLLGGLFLGLFSIPLGWLLTKGYKKLERGWGLLAALAGGTSLPSWLLLLFAALASD